MALAALLAAPRLGAQGISSLISPGKLSKPHAKLEGLDKCQSCHEPGRQVSAAKCLECHKPVAERIKAKKGVHRDVTTVCAKCHIEHAGLDGDLRHFETKPFDHKGQTGFALDGLHAPLDCKLCHKTRSFLGLTTACASCHKDAHNGALGAACQTCHPTSVAFKSTRKSFDHSVTKYPLTGAHAKTPCESCHKTKGEYRIARFAACDDCHKNPHQPPLGTCSTCHVTASFKTLVEGQKFDHAKTAYPLRGRHASVACQTCHVKPAARVKLKYARCADCHHDAHKGVFPATEDCASCHTETGFKPGKFDHTARTKFPLDGKHATTACAACHKAAGAQANVRLALRVVDFRGAKKECVSCHTDVHKGKLGTTCQTCHGTATFKLATYQHPRQPEFFLGAHAGVACEKCHLPEKGATTAPVKGATTAPAKGAATGPVKGAATAPVKGAAVPVGSRQYRGVSFQCAACHKDPHLGQVASDCAKCHGLAAKGFKPDLFVHTQSKFAITGKHEGRALRKVPRERNRHLPRGQRHGRSPHGDFDGVPRLPQGSAPRPALAALRDLPQHRVLQGPEVRPPGEEGVRRVLRREARDDRLRGVPPEGDFQLSRRPGSDRAVLAPGQLRALPRGRPPRHPRAGLRHLPHRPDRSGGPPRAPSTRPWPSRSKASTSPSRARPAT